MSKRIIAALLALAMTAGLAACGNGGTSTSESGASESGTASTDSSTAEESGGEAETGNAAWIASSDVEDDAVPGENDGRAFKKFDEVVEITFG